MRLPSGAFQVALAVAARPRLWAAAVRAVRSLVPPRWWRRPPFLPLPDQDWVAFRMTTAYGDPAAPLDRHDVIVWLEWSRTVRPRPLGPPHSGDENSVPRSVAAG